MPEFIVRAKEHDFPTPDCFLGRDAWDAHYGR